MLTTKASAEGLAINYDGNEFGIIPYAPDCIGVTCMRRGEWDFYEKKPYRSIAEACEAIFYGTILVNRTECGHIQFDMFGNYTGIIPLTYYES